MIACKYKNISRKNRNIETHFKKMFPNSDSYIVPGVRSEGQDSGRAKGGLAQLSVKDLGVRKERVITSSWRLQAQILHCDGGQRILWFNVYFPTDPRVQNYDESELLPVLNEIEKILESCEYDDCCVGGDLNTDVRRDTGFVRAVTRFMDKIGLVSVWEKFKIDFTHVHTDLKSFSILDNFYVNKDFLEMVEDAGPVHCVTNMSRHSPIMMKVKLREVQLPKASVEPRPRPRQPAWFKASEREKHLFTDLLDNKLKNILQPEALKCIEVQCKCEEHTQERDKFVLDVMCASIEASHQAIPLKGKGIKKGCKPKPGWKETVKPQRTDAMFWHGVWKSAGRPNTGQLYEQMKHYRNQYHYAVRRTQREAEALQAARLREAAVSGDMALMTELKKTLSKQKNGQQVPESLEGEVTEDGILAKFRELYEKLYNSAGTEEEVGRLKLQLSDMIKEDAITEVNKVTCDIVKKACQRMKPGKSDVSESYTSDVFLNAPDSLFHALAAVFRSFLVHGTVTLSILSCAFLPLYKGGHKKPDQFTSYRAIAGASQLLKLWDYVVLEIWGGHLSTDSMQFGFKKHMSTTQCSWLVTEVCGHFLRRRSSVYVALMDCSMAFDKCLFSKLFYKLSSKLPAIVVRALLWVYEEQTGCVKLGERRSNSFTLTNGTRQGSVLSPALWCVYLDDLLVELRSLKLGCYVQGAGLWIVEQILGSLISW